MAKASTRFRNRKINYKTRITVRTGSSAYDFEEDSPDAGEVEFEEDKSNRHGGGGVETGVDKEEEHELHLQAVLASSSASVSRSGGAGASGSGSSGVSGTRGGSGASTSKGAPPKAFIPVPDAAGTIEQSLFNELYPANAWTDPVTYVRFSDTVEDATIGAVLYTMDEDDEDWLEAYNATVANSNGADVKPSTSASLALETVTNGSPGGRGARKRLDKGKGVEDKGKEVVVGPVVDDDFEAVMQFFEKVCDEVAPMAHVNLASLPSFEDMELHLPTSDVLHLKAFARACYPHWKQRRTLRGGKSIIPQLDYDESNENNPYVCFRRRELKTSRKTRRSDAQNVERLIRLRNDLHAALALMEKTRDRERLKHQLIEVERKVFESRCEVRDLKRRLGEAEGDEDILIGRREKKRKRDVDGPTSANSVRLTLRQPGANPTTVITPLEELKQRKDRAAAIASRIDRDLVKKKEADQGWEDFTDTAFSARPPSIPARFWRAVETVPGCPSFVEGPNGKFETLAFSTTLQPTIGQVRTNFRRRVGRGGRVMLDRIAPGLGRRPRVPSPTPSEASDDSDDEEQEDDLAARRRAERFRYDQDANIEFPSIDEPSIIDDFSFPLLLQRSRRLFKQNDTEFLSPDTSYLDQALAHVSQEPERPPPPTVFGRPPPRQLPPQPTGPGGVPVSANAQGTLQQMQMQVASQAHRITHLQAQQQQQQQPQPQQIRQAVPGGPQTPGSAMPNAMSKTPSNTGSPVLLPMQNGAPVQGQWVNGSPIPTKLDGLPAGYNGHLQLPAHIQLQQQQQQQQQRLSQGMVAAMPAGANGQPATSRLSAPPFSNGSPMQLPIQTPLHAQPHQLALSSSPLPHNLANHHLQQRPASANSNHGQSPKSAHPSPSMAAQGIPNHLMATMKMPHHQAQLPYLAQN